MITGVWAFAVDGLILWVIWLLVRKGEGQMQIDPNVKGFINLGLAVCGVIGTVGVSAFPDYVPTGVAKDIVQTAALIFMVYGGLNSAGNFLSSNQPGLLAPKDPPIVVEAKKVAALPETATPQAVSAAKADATAAVAAHQP